ncbi:MAG: hypothetical protein LUB59_02870 [Candidatus Gastranaerophilales bacterium]|nr:hypothetical protein [Candidatus Gastranaerophilales bacterium]
MQGDLKSQDGNAIKEPVSSDDSSDLKSLWVQILRAIPYQADQALLTLANPVKISPDGIVITFKNPNFVQKANTQEKKRCISDAAASVLGKSDIPVTIREPHADDKKIEKIKVTLQKKPIVPPKSLVDEPDEVTEQELEMFSQESEAVSTVKAGETDYSHSDQSNMVKQLFDGKFLD